ncbi:MAG TPA: tRNA lysidine(34) synthetase TilS, partial [Flavobacteriaceae bacterium]|nr:tRNA lysidine(34) synthetase TilS [Flavobacteriaceae bacterium]
FSREQIEAYAQSEHLKWREDSSNASTKYLRNKLRHEIIPKLKEINPELLKNFQSTQANLQESQWLVDESISRIFKKMVDEVKEDKVYFSIKKLKKLKESKPYLYQFLKPYGFTEWDDVANLLEAQTGKQVFSATHGLLKNREQLILFERESHEVSSILIESSNARVATAMGALCFEEVQEISTISSNSIWVDKDLLKFPLTVRQWKKGDYFYPLGMQGKKRLSKFFKDEKYSLLDKEKALVLCSQDQIIWVVNKRMDNRYKVTEKTKNILKITIN